ncbi:MAG: site-specific DNA-methyltransferase [Bacteroidetes bacterium]|nr:MAG: site-specific DNA-methyltransferase [Bacteroidota bacterium]REK05180.1 MAG: site-specific DNA-methyltransferase [Bacteroidota bacterium]REK32585.1 MAG: site-specific DNA-methyltransferase [Bacteroidota bacterium]REK48968.1 MAG: site-specific DNA-methyltransferase [Bacteroidota bacterium]
MRGLAYESKYALNAICPYFTMFPLEFPLKILKKHKEQSPVILDPFCGRGTTIYAARELGLSAWGIDTSPIAVAIAKAKLATSKKSKILSLARKLIATPAKNIPTSKFFRNAYSNSTLKEVCALREGLFRIRKETDESVLLRAAALGCLHGPLTKTIDTASYFSNQMPRTFSTKPDYSCKYWKERDLVAPKVSVIKVLERKLNRIGNLEDESTGSPVQILCSDSSIPMSYESIPDDISIVVTSPPYYGMRTYIQDQWLRLWFLGGPEDLLYENNDQLNHHGQLAFINDLASVWTNISLRSDAEDLHLYVRLGSIPSTKSDPKEIFYSSLEESGGWKLVSTRSAKTADEGRRQADHMATTSKATIEYDFHAVRR